MNTLLAQLRHGLYCVALGVCALCAPSLARAQTSQVTIAAEATPNVLDPSRSVFTITTPKTGLCVNWPTRCGADEYSVPTNIWIAGRAMGGDTSKPRVNYFMAVDAREKDVEVVHEDGSRYPLRFRITRMSQRYLTTNNGAPGTYGANSGGCTAMSDIGTSAWHSWAWGLPDRTLSCNRNTGHTARSITIDGISLAYKLVTPDPLVMRDGTYTGSLTYTVGPGKQLDFGDGDYKRSELKLDFVLTVKHQFRVDFPSQTPTVTLVPEGGWWPWTDLGRAPASLSQQLPFHLTSSIPFSMKLRCEHDAAGDRCGIRNAADDVVVPVDVDVTAPGMIDQRDRRPMQRTPLSPVPANAPYLTPLQPLHNQRSILRFTAGREAVAEMVKSPGSKWQGNITVLFDANP